MLKYFRFKKNAQLIFRIFFHMQGKKENIFIIFYFIYLSFEKKLIFS